MCDYIATHQNNIKNHNEGVMKVISICATCVNIRQNQREHRKAVHENIKYSCNMCDYQTEWKHDLTTHKRSKHPASTSSN